MLPLAERGYPLRRYCQFIRIADDDLGVSSVHCPRCLEKKGEATYPPPLRHGSEGAGTTVTVIDVAIETRGMMWTITRLNRNAKFVVGGVPTQARTRFLPPYRPPFVTTAQRTAWISGSLALDAQRHRSVPHQRTQGLLLCFELLRMQHTPKQIDASLRAIQHPFLADTARFLGLCMRIIARTTSSTPLNTHLFQLLTPWLAVEPAIARIPTVIE